MAGRDVFLLGIGSLLCVAAFLCAICFAIARRRKPLRICGITVTALSALIVTDVIVAAVLDAQKPAMATGQVSLPNVVATPPHEAPPAEALRNFTVYWRDIVRLSAAALKAHDRAGEDLRTGNMVRAAAELQNCQDIAGGIATYSADLQVGLDNGSDFELLAAIKKVGDGLLYGCRSARAYLETSAAPDFEDAKARFADVVDGVVQAESLARAKYQRLGGNPESLASFKTALR